jgi:hypothetical protein
MNGKRGKRSSKSDQPRGNRRRQDWDERPAHSSIYSICDEHSFNSGQSSIEDLGWIGRVALNGLKSAPLRKSNADLDNKKADSGLASLANISDPEGLLSGIIGRDIVEERKLRHHTASGAVFNVEYDKWIIWPLLEGAPGRLVINPRKIKQGKELGILQWKPNPFEVSPKVVTQELYCQLIDMCDLLGNKVRRTVTRQEEKDGVR